jgi:hypothetical protein
MRMGSQITKIEIEHLRLKIENRLRPEMLIFS